MGCCGKGKIRNIAHGLGSYAIEKATGLQVGKYQFTDDRIRICQQCDFKEWRNNGKSLWCTVCGCFVPAKARVESEKCEKGFWPNENLLDEKKL